MAKVFVDVNIFGDVSEESEVVVVLGRAVDVADLVVTNRDRRRGIAEGDPAIRDGQSDRRQLDDVRGRILRRCERKENKLHISSN